MLPRSSARQSEPIPQGCPSQLKKVLAELISQPGARKPESVKFFRGQMQTIITRALIDLEIKPVPSRRCFTLLSALLRHALKFACCAAECMLHSSCLRMLFRKGLDLADRDAACVCDSKTLPLCPVLHPRVQRVPFCVSQLACLAPMW